MLQTKQRVTKSNIENSFFLRYDGASMGNYGPFEGPLEFP